MELSRQEYPNLLTQLQPAQAVNVLNDRVRLIGKINNDIADWLSERRRVEEAYVQGLRRLSKRPQQDGAAALGIFQMPWQRIVSATEEIAQSHETFAARIDADVETPLRQFTSKNREFQSMSTIQGNLGTIVKDLETAQKRQEKIKDKTRASADRVAHANISADEAQAQWDSQAPFVFEQLQAADETRLNHLRDVLTQYQTHEADHTERNRALAESCLNALLNIETADEIKTFAARVIGNRGNISRRQSSAAGQVPPPTLHVPPMPPPPRKTEARQPHSLGASPSQERLKPESSKHGALGGIKRLGTVMGRRKSQLPPPNAASPEKPKKSRGFAPFRREDSSKFQPMDSPPPDPRDLTLVPSRGEELSPQPSVPQGLSEPLQPRMAEQPISEEPNDTPMNQNTPAPGPITNGNVAHDSSNLLSPEAARQAPLPAIPVSEQPTLRQDPISLAQQEAAAYNGENEDALRSLTIRDQPIQEDEGEAKEAFNTMANQLRLQARQNLRPQGSVRGRRDVRNTIFIPNPEPIEAANGVSTTGAQGASSLSPVTAALSPQGLASPIKRAGVIPEDRASDANSIHSSHTLSSIGGTYAHPDLNEPGLNASIVETVSTWFADGVVTKSFAIGEVALAYNPTTDGDNQTNETIRLDNFQLLEKVAANPAFVTANASDKGKGIAGSEDSAGEYSLSLSSITKHTPTVGFKYQLHMEADAQSMYSPVLLTTAWQIQETQASVIIGYNLNPSFDLSTTATPTTITLKNFALTVSLDISSAESGKASTAMMAPQNGATFRKKQSAVVWKLPELIVTSEPQRLLARFITTGPNPPKQGHVEAKWELHGQTASSLGVSIISGAGADVDPFADTGASGGAPTTPTKTWTPLQVSRKLVTGRYSA